MFSKKDMFGAVSVKGAIDSRVGSVVFDKDDSSELVAEKINMIMDEAKDFPDIPNFTVIITTHNRPDETVASVKLTVKTRKADRVGDSNCHTTVVIPYDEYFKKSIVDFAANWVDNYRVAVKAQCNIDKLNELTEANCGAIKIKFVRGSEIIEAMSNDSVTLGITDSEAADIAEFEMFSDVESLRELRISQYTELLQSFTKPQDVIKCKASVFGRLNIYTRCSVASILKKVYRKNITRDVKDNDICRLEYKDEVTNTKFFGLIKKVKASEVSEGVEPAITKGDYSYFVVLSPFAFGKNGFVTLSDSDTAAVIDSIV